MSWKDKIDELKRRQESARKLGGDHSIAYQHRIGKLSVRERIEILLDRGSFSELGMTAGSATYGEKGNLVSFTPSNAVIGKGRIGGRKVVISADDFTIRGGSSESTISDKWVYAERYAHEMQMPLIRLVDTAGGSVRLLEKSGSTKIPGYPTWPVMQLMGIVPVVGVALGSCAGLGAVKVCGSHFSVMVKGPRTRRLAWRNWKNITSSSPPPFEQQKDSALSILSIPGIPGPSCATGSRRPMRMHNWPTSY